MAKRANPTLIGAFVLGGIALTVGAILLLGGREWFKRPVLCLMAFDGNVAGLTVGSPVSFRGVQLGSVSSIQLRSGTVLIVVLTQIDPSRIRGMPGPITRERVEQSIQDAVKNGLRAQLQVLSLLTGQLYVGLDYYPDTPARMTGLEKDHCEIPTIPTVLAQFQDQVKKLMAELEELPLKQIVEAAARTVEGVDRLVHAPELARAVKSLDLTLVEAQALMRNVNARVDPAATALQATLEEAQRAIARVGGDVHKLVEDVDSQVKPLVANIESTSDSARALMRDAQQTVHGIDAQLGPALTSVREAGDAARDALRRAETSLSQVEGVLDGNSPLGYQLAETLNEVTRAARALRFLSEEIDRQPNVLLFGRGGSKE